MYLGQLCLRISKQGRGLSEGALLSLRPATTDTHEGPQLLLKSVGIRFLNIFEELRHIVCSVLFW